VTFRIAERQAGDVTILDIAGNLTLGTSSTFRDTLWKLVQEGKSKLLINMQGVHYIDSSGIGELVSAYTTVKNRGGVIKVMTLRNKPRDLLQITKLYTVYETFGGESAALRSFQPGLSLLYCTCPVCHRRADSMAEDDCDLTSQICPVCGAGFTIDPPIRGSASVPVRNARIESFLDEYFEIVSGPPFMVKVIGRLNLFTTFALQKAWNAVPTPRRMVFDLAQATEVDDEGRRALLALLETMGEESTRATVSVEGLAREHAEAFPAEPPFYSNRGEAVAALGDISDTPKWCVSVERSDT
jgi:anti-sigma B factor antagonist